MNNLDHVAFIMDGNGRWGVKKGKGRNFGHLQGIETVKKIVEKELDIIKAEITNSGKPKEMAEKISKGKISKFLKDNSLLNQIWIMDPKKNVSQILKENSTDKPLQVSDFIRYKVGEGV